MKAILKFATKRESVAGAAIFAIAALALLIAMPPQARSQDFNSRNIATFTAQQADRGKAAYGTSCASCHGATLNGSEFASALRGTTFTQNWGGRPASVLFEYVNTKMPPASPGSLGPETNAAVVAFLLQSNGIQPSDTELPTDMATLALMQIPRGATSRPAAMMPLSPLAPPIPVVKLPNPLEQFTPVTDAMLDNPPATDWLLWRRTYDDQGFSPLKQIDRKNVANLRVAWAWSLPPGTNEGTPLEHDGVLFIESYGDKLEALNATTGDLLWEYSHPLPKDARFDQKRNIAIHGERVFMPTSDDHVVALDVKSGDVIWDQAIADYTEGYQITGGPLVAKGKVMQGVGGQAKGGNFIVALDEETGKEAWRFHTIAQAGEPGDSWNGLPDDKRNGASVWTAGSYDPKLNLAFFGAGQTYDTGPVLHRVPGQSNDGLYTDTTMAFDPDSGKLVWHFQHVHNDQWDLDWAFERQLIDLPVDGAERHLVVTSGKMAIYEALDAATGQYVFSKDLGIQNVIASIDPKTGEKTISPGAVMGDDKPHLICPHPGGGRNWVAGSYNAETKMMYIAMNESCMDLIPAGKGQRGNLTSGYNWFIRPRPDTDGNYGRVEAFNLETKKVIWKDRQRAPQMTGMLDTAGGVVFSGAFDRYLKAYDDSTGKLLWQIRLNDVPNSCPITYSVNGKQYLAVVTGTGGPMTATYPVLVPEIQVPPDRESSIWVFELPEK